MFQMDYGGALIFFFSDEKSYLGTTKEMFIHLCESRHTHKQETKLWGFSTYREKGPCRSSVRTSQSAGSGAQGNPSSVFISTFSDRQCSGSELRESTDVLGRRERE